MAMVKKKIPDKFKKLVRGAVEDYRYLLGRIDYRGDILYMVEDVPRGEDSAWLYAEACVDHRYLKADFKIYPCFVEDWKRRKFDDEKAKSIIAHEVAHIATHHMFYLVTAIYKDEGESKDAWESLTETIGRLLYTLDKHKNCKL